MGDGFVQPEGAFHFDGEVAGAFGEMLDRSVPQLALMRDTVARFAAPFVRNGSHVVDLGASLGDAVAAVRERTALESVRYVLIERAPAMLEALHDRYGDDPAVRIEDTDLRSDYPTVRASLTLSVLTLQFVPIERRLALLDRVRRSTISGGALIIVEKVLGSTAALDSALLTAHRSAKRDAGYSDDEIDRNLLALEGVLVPLTASMNETLLHGAGFDRVESIWRWGNFAAWLALPGGEAGDV